MSNKTNVVEELTFEEYWERYSCASDTPKMAARAAWILAIKQERRLQEARPTQRAAGIHTQKVIGSSGFISARHQPLTQTVGRKPDRKR